MTLGALGLRGLSGQVTLVSDGKQYSVAFDQGVVIGAYSPVANDAAVRVALTGNLITSSQVGEIMRRLAAAPGRDEVEVLAEACRLQPDQAQRLRRRLVAQRAARTFSVDQGDFVVEDELSIQVVPGSELDVRTIVYLGARNNLGDDRLGTELGQLGAWFKLKPEAVDDLPQYGFTEDEKPILQMLLQGANLSDMQLSNAGLGVRTVRAVTYALAVCGACEASSTPLAAPQRSQSASVPPRTVSTTVPPVNMTAPAGSQTVLRGAAPTTPPRTTTSTTHKTAPLGSRSPAAPSTPPTNRAGTSSAPPMARGSDRERSRTASASYRVPTASDTGRASSTNLRAPTNNVGRTPTPPSPSNPYAGRTPTPGHAPATPRTITQSSGVPHATEAGRSSGNTARPRTPTSRPGSLTSPPMPRTTTQSSGPHMRPPAVGRTPTPGSSQPLVARTSSSSQSLRARTTSSSSSSSSMATTTRIRPPRRPKQSTAATLEIEALLAKKMPMLDQGVDYFTLFGLHVGASPDDVRSTYFMLARKLHPDRLAAIGVDDEGRQAQRLMACINEAFAVLNDPVRRAEYESILARGGEAAVRAEEQRADELAMRVMRAEEAFRQGEMALRRDQIAQALQSFSTAVELQPNEPEYQALFAWAQFAHSADKPTIAPQVRKALIRAADANPDSPTARFYLGRVERMLGREKEALVYFHEVLRIKPNHSEASSEARILEQRLKNKR